MTTCVVLRGLVSEFASITAQVTPHWLNAEQAKQNKVRTVAKVVKERIVVLHLVIVVITQSL
jgi:hypothetical protein